MAELKNDTGGMISLSESIKNTKNVERQRKLASRLAQDRKFATTMSQTGSWVNWNNWAEVLGQPFDVTKIPLSKLEQMRRDPMIAFGLMFIKVPIIRANWGIISSDPQRAAFIENALRPIYGRFILAYLNSMDYGYSPIVKRFEYAIPDWTYIDPKTGEEKEVWPDKNIKALVWKPFIALNPRKARPKFNSKGEFSGIDLVPPYSSAFSSVFGGDGRPADVPLDWALWVTNEKDSEFGCQPAGELVLTTTEGYVPIEKLDPEKHKLVSFGGNKILRYSGKNGIKGHEFELGERNYSGNLLKITVADKSIKTTPNHKFTVKWAKEAEKYWAVYLMRKNNWWRIGTTKFALTKKQANSGIENRLQKENADKAWLIKLFETKEEAIYYETLWSHQYNIPKLTFISSSGSYLTTNELEEIWNKIDSETGANKLLEDFKLYKEYPLHERCKTGRANRKKQAGNIYSWTCYAANLISGLMELPVDPGEGQKPIWQKISVECVPYSGIVYSINVPPHHHYISNGIITQNSLYGYPRIGYAYRAWWSYWYKFALSDRAFEKWGDPPFVVFHPADEGVEDSDGNPIDFGSEALNVAEQLRSGANVAMPSSVIRGYTEDRPTNVREWDFKQVETTANFAALNESFEYLDILKLRSVLVPEQALAEGRGGTSSRNVAAEFGDLLKESQAVVMEEIDDHINRFMIPQLLEANFGPDGPSCRKVTTGFDPQDIETMRNIVQAVANAKGGIPEVDMLAMLKQLGVPHLSYDAIERSLKDIADESSKTKTELSEEIDLSEEEKGLFRRIYDKIINSNS